MLVKTRIIKENIQQEQKQVGIMAENMLYYYIIEMLTHKRGNKNALQPLYKYSKLIK